MTYRTIFFMKTGLMLILAMSLTAALSCKRKISCNPDEGSVCPPEPFARQCHPARASVFTPANPVMTTLRPEKGGCLRYADDTYACTPDALRRHKYLSGRLDMRSGDG